MTEENDNVFKLVKRLKKEIALVARLYKGDIVVDDNDFWVVEDVVDEPNGFVSVIGENGGGYINVPANQTCQIVQRSSLYY